MMNREMLFRGKHIHAMDSNEHLNGRWVKGYLSDKDYIHDEHLEGEFLIDEYTICQYTGLTDKNGKKIWENDIVFVTDEEGCSGQIDTGVGEIDFLGGCWYISGNVQNGLYDIDRCFQVEVIGNIYDNPELLEEENVHGTD